MKKLTLFLTTVFTAGFLTACDDDDNGSNDTPEPADSLEVPETYKWNDAEFEKSTAAIELLATLSQEVAKANDPEGSVQESELQNIFKNNGVVDASTSIADQIPQDDVAMFETYFEKLQTQTNNPSGDTVANGRYYFENRVEPLQLIEKGLMGACLYYQATSKKLNGIASVPNENPKESDAPTEREKQFDEAFGYLGVPKNLTQLSSGEKDEVEGEYQSSSWFWGHYLRSRNGQLQNKETLFNAFLKGRKAITEQRPEKLDEALNTIYREWEKLVAANVAHYANSTIADIENKATDSKWHHWAEAKAFNMGLRYNPKKQISSEAIDKIDERLGETPSEVTIEDLEQINEDLDGIYDFPSPITSF